MQRYNKFKTSLRYVHRLRKFDTGP